MFKKFLVLALIVMAAAPALAGTGPYGTTDFTDNEKARCQILTNKINYYTKRVEHWQEKIKKHEASDAKNADALITRAENIIDNLVTKFLLKYASNYVSMNRYSRTGAWIASCARVDVRLNSLPVLPDMMYPIYDVNNGNEFLFGTYYNPMEYSINGPQ